MSAARDEIETDPFKLALYVALALNKAGQVRLLNRIWKLQDDRRER